MCTLNFLYKSFVNSFLATPTVSATVLCLYRTTCLPFTGTPSHPLRKACSYWNLHEKNIYGIWAGHRMKHTHTHRFMQVRYLSRHDLSKSMTPSTLKKAQQRHKQTQTQLFSTKDGYLYGKKEEGKTPAVYKCSLVISPILCALRSGRHNHSLNMFTVSFFFFTIQCPTQILHFQNGTTRAKCLWILKEFF